MAMTAAAGNPFDASPVPVLPPDTEPAETLDLNRVLDVLRNNHRIAWLTQQQGHAAHRRMLDKAAEIERTGKNPDAVSIEDVKALITRRLGE